MSDDKHRIPADALPFVRLAIATHLLQHNGFDCSVSNMGEAVEHVYKLADLLIAKAAL